MKFTLTTLQGGKEMLFILQIILLKSLDTVDRNYVVVFVLFYRNLHASIF